MNNRKQDTCKPCCCYPCVPCGLHIQRAAQICSIIFLIVSIIWLIVPWLIYAEFTGDENPPKNAKGTVLDADWKFHFFEVGTTIYIQICIAILYLLISLLLVWGTFKTNVTYVLAFLLGFILIHIAVICVLVAQKHLICSWHSSCRKKYKSVMMICITPDSIKPAITKGSQCTSWYYQKFYLHYLLEFVFIWYLYWVCYVYYVWLTRSSWCKCLTICPVPKWKDQQVVVQVDDETDGEDYDEEDDDEGESAGANNGGIRTGKGKRKVGGKGKRGRGGGAQSVSGKSMAGFVGKQYVFPLMAPDNTKNNSGKGNQGAGRGKKGQQGRGAESGNEQKKGFFGKLFGRGGKKGNDSSGGNGAGTGGAGTGGTGMGGADGNRRISFAEDVSKEEEDEENIAGMKRFSVTGIGGAGSPGGQRRASLGGRRTSKVIRRTITQRTIRKDASGKPVVTNVVRFSYDPSQVTKQVERRMSQLY